MVSRTTKHAPRPRTEVVLEDIIAESRKPMSLWKWHFFLIPRKTVERRWAWLRWGFTLEGKYSILKRPPPNNYASPKIKYRVHHHTDPNTGKTEVETFYET